MNATIMRAVNDYGIEFNLGDRVRLRDKRATARIKNFYPDIEGGVVLDTKLEGLRSWNVNDLERVSEPQP